MSETRVVKGGWLAAAALALGAAVMTAAPALAKTQLTVYTAIEADQLRTYKAAFEQDNPDIEINWVRDSTGVITAKLLAEKNNPQADVVWGLAREHRCCCSTRGHARAYAPPGVDKLDRRFSTPPTRRPGSAWTPGSRSICFNTVEAREARLPQPTSWADLAKPEYKGTS